jgi:crotonobetainyl-CoA:carnitine CoA-transferase CaiB-like acyl-CoA transferase
MAGPLNGVRIIDITTMLMGPSATQLLGDLGAEIIKIESSDGDPMRHLGPMRNPGMGPLYLNSNRNKRSLVLDLKDSKDLQSLLELITTADVFISNLRLASLERLGISADKLCITQPRLIHCSAEGYGDGGPYSGRAAYDDMIQAQCGLSGLFSQIESEPKLLPINLCDRITGMQLANTVLAALFERERSGLGQSIKCAMFETMVNFVMADHMGGASFLPSLGPPGYARLMSKARKPFRTRNGHLCAAIYTNEHWRRFLVYLGEEAILQNDYRFKNIESRIHNADIVLPWIGQKIEKRTSEEWVSIFNELDIPAAKVNSLVDLLNDDHLKTTGFYETCEHPTEGPVITMRNPTSWSRTNPQTRRLAPNLGEANLELTALLQLKPNF